MGKYLAVRHKCVSLHSANEGMRLFFEVSGVLGCFLGSFPLWAGPGKKQKKYFAGTEKFSTFAAPEGGLMYLGL
ncbi:hypothetical protein H8S90_01830 [Olivibacter sp. SDN3]|uniref:hypothetical protein n=1 Tax=Olivibacter sp. SDN3 TaxID=2764720 RepID=UPI00165109A7|nr:hypothetical protein [Olivibacter sp. SDN3]QNL50388.1 hypothetical protein H8S90_01830 [Olivibacter sp. SDN3]